MSFGMVWYDRLILLFCWLAFMWTYFLKSFVNEKLEQPLFFITLRLRALKFRQHYFALLNKEVPLALCTKFHFELKCKYFLSQVSSLLLSVSSCSHSFSFPTFAFFLYLSFTLCLPSCLLSFSHFLSLHPFWNKKILCFHRVLS